MWTPVEEYLVALRNSKNVTIRDMSFASDPGHQISGAFHCSSLSHVKFLNLHIAEYRWAGIHINKGNNIEIGNCIIRHASTVRCKHQGGLIRTKWIKDSRIHHNQIIGKKGGGYGYKAGGHENVRIDHNYISTGYFAIESAHEHEFGVEIDHNYLTRCMSIPKSNNSANPKERGYDYSFWIHDNYLTDSYTIEGPRNYLIFEDNYVKIEKKGGRVYTHHGGRNNGPVVIRRNVIENVDRSFIWMNEGLAEGIEVTNNTVICAVAGENKGSIFGAYSGDRLNGWVARNNVFIAPESEPRSVRPTQRGVSEKIEITHNLFVNFKGVPEGNFEGETPGFKATGEKPWPYYTPADGKSFLVDRGMDTGFPFEGKAPDLGAYELGKKRPSMNPQFALADGSGIAASAEPETRRTTPEKPTRSPEPDTPATTTGELPTPNKSAAAPPSTDKEPTTDSPEGTKMVEVNWLEELLEGGFTMVALGLLSVAMLAFGLERFFVLRENAIVPRRLAKEVAPLFHEGRFDDILKICQKHKSSLARVIATLVQQRKDTPKLILQNAADVGARDIGRQEQRNLPLAVIATLAPLLGLLGTMIGMIESFKLVEVFGDEGGASMLAGAISKALITTAGGLLLAIPAIVLYNFFRIRLYFLATTLEEQTEQLVNLWFKKGPEQ